MAINFFGVGIFGEFEFWLSSIKVLIMLGLIVFTFVLACGGGPQESAPGFRYWTNPGAFAPYLAKGGPGRFLGFWNVLGSASFSFNGAELVGVTVGEAQNPRRAVPRAVKLTFFRIVFFYIILIFLLGLNVPYNSPELVSANTFGAKTISAKSSPFVVAASLAGVSTVPDIINVCLLVFTFSAANSDLYISTRALYSLAIEGNAPRIFAHTNDRGVPIYSLTLSSLLALIAFISVDVGAFETFQYFVSLVTIFGLLTWMAILISHIYFVRARRAQVVPDTSLAYVSPFGINGSFAALIFAAVILFFNGFSSFTPDPVTKERFQWRNFIVNYIGVVIFVSMAAGYKYFVGTKVWSAHEADLTSGKQKIDDDEAEFLAAEKARPVNETEERIRRWYRLTIGHFF
ncbi:amino acid permease/ SLC12A domain-containing protein [Amylocarpus encephaloides]|uniref:Amino acid permease/ SLC12A domain-containing protein n=1 Tax=Amylocarpus encephaloides TaxID=45428 RepID=A0A9P7YNZ0_9HELO|nr:amino acid permease/ SLC12A domain-containing protein [Amylocarpus encephaloides]